MQNEMGKAGLRAEIGIIGGSGVYDIPGFRALGTRTVNTPWGAPSGDYMIGEISGTGVAFLPRHGPEHRIAPHRINYRANIMGFSELGVNRIISINATGGIGAGLEPGDIVVCDQVLDMTQGAREGTFFDDEVVHVDFTEPYCPELRAAALEAAVKVSIKARPAGTYICVNGPRLESRAEIKLFSSMGADVVGMTAMPEAVLARELQMCMACISVVTNYAAGFSKEKLTTAEVVQCMRRSNDRIKLLLKETFPLIPAKRNCPCKDALEGTRMSPASDTKS